MNNTGSEKDPRATLLDPPSVSSTLCPKACSVSLWLGDLTCKLEMTLDMQHIAEGLRGCDRRCLRGIYVAQYKGSTTTPSP